MPAEVKKVRFKQTAILYTGRMFVIVKEVPLLPSDKPPDYYQEFLKQQ